jgi:UDP-glucose 4-epimerase
MRIGVTGANGFLGSWLCNLLSREHQVVGYVRPGSSTSRLKEGSNLRLKSFSLGATNFLQNEGVEVLLMLDWQGVGNEERDSPNQLQNIVRQEQIISFAAQAGVRKVFGFGSQAELGPLGIPASENLTDNPSTKYGAAKVAARMQHIELCETLDLSWIWCRVFSTYGPKDSETWLIPGILSSLAKNKKFPLTKCEQIWSFLHVLDFANAVEALLTYSPNRIVHIGNPNTVSLLDVIGIIGELTGKRNLLDVGSIPYRKDQVMLLSPECAVLESIGWNPRVSLRNGISHMIESSESKSGSLLELSDGSRVLL